MLYVVDWRVPAVFCLLHEGQPGRLQQLFRVYVCATSLAPALKHAGCFVVL